MTDTTQTSEGNGSGDLSQADVERIADNADLLEWSEWERKIDKVFAWAPYATLALSIVLTQLGDPTTQQRAISLGVGLVAAVWTLLTFTRFGPPSQQAQMSLRIYFAGFVVLAAFGMFHDWVFIVYAISGFLSASLLRPWALAISSIAVVSLIVYSTIVYPGGGTVEWLIYLGVVAFQTVAIGFGLFAGEHLMEIASDRRNALEKLEAARIENEGLHAQLVEQAREAGVLDERQRLAREIHDTIAQDLTGVITQIEAARQAWGDDAAVNRHLDNASGLARGGLTEARRSVQAIRPSELDEHRLPDAIRHSANSWSSTHDVPVEVTVTGDVHALPTDVEVSLLRASQEGLTNVGKHAEASRAAVTLTYLDNAVALDVRDDGVGFDPDVPKGNSYGLEGMRQRLAGVGGVVTIESGPGEGTALSVRIPHQFSEDDTNE